MLMLFFLITLKRKSILLWHNLTAYINPTHKLIKNEGTFNNQEIHNSIFLFVGK